MRNRSSFVILLTGNLFFLLAAIGAGPSPAQGFKPSRQVDLIVHNGPGSGVDVTARFVNGLLEREKLLPVRAVVINKPGGNGAVAAAYMTEKKGDAHTIAFFTALWIGSPLTSKESRVQFHELTPIARLILDPAVIVVKADSPYKTLPEFIEAARKAPGQLRQAGGSVDSRDNLTRQLLQRATGTSWTYIPFPGGGERVAAVLGGHASLYIADAQEVKEYLRNGSMRILAQMAERRMPAYSSSPTLQEAGYNIPIVRSMRGVVGPPGMPKEAAEYWENVFERLVKTEAWRKYLEENQVEDGFQKGAELAQSAVEFIAQRRQIFKEAGIPTYR
jgi:putative tricarboxylic transport membrane protein